MKSSSSLSAINDVQYHQAPWASPATWWHLARSSDNTVLENIIFKEAWSQSVWMTWFCRIEKASFLSSTPNTSCLIGHRLDFDTSLGFRTAYVFQKCCHRHGIELLIWQDMVPFTSTVTYGGGGGEEMRLKGGCFASLLSLLSLF